MKKKQTYKTLLSFVLVFLFVFSAVSNASVFTFETQYSYDHANLAWLTDLIIKEDMTTANGLIDTVLLEPDAVSPYGQSPAGFKKEIDYLSDLYLLSPESAKAGYLYICEVLGSDTGVFAADATDDTVKDYLQGIGIIYPANPNEDELVVAKALYTALVTGAFSNSGSSRLTGVSLQEALVTYISSISGISRNTLQKWTPDETVLDLDAYVLAASRLTLWTNGYDVTAQTPESEVYRLVAVMTMEQLGLNIDKTLSFEELKIRYMSALIGKKYGVALEPSAFKTAFEQDCVAYYVLTQMGKTVGLSLREENTPYEDAFWLVAEKTDFFDLEAGEFYADIYRYHIYLTDKRSQLWIYPTAYASGNDSATISITANGNALRNRYYTKIAIDPEKEEQSLSIGVTVKTALETASCSYEIIVHQGEHNEQSGEQTTSNSVQIEEKFADSNTVVKGILNSLNADKSVIDMVDDFYAAVPQTVKSVISFIAPTFDGSVTSASPITEEAQNATQIQSNDYYITVLDSLEKASNMEISGIDGLELINNTITNGILNAVTFD